MKSASLILFCFAFKIAIGQATHIDQIKGNLSNQPNDTSKVRLYLKASQHHTFHDLDKALAYADSSFTLSKILKYGDGVGYSGLNLAYLYRIQGKYGPAIQILHNTLNQLKNTATPKAEYLKIYRWLGKNHYESRQYDSALYWSRKAIGEAKKLQKVQQLVYAYSDHANIFYKKYDFDRAVLFYSKADSVCEQHGLNSVSYLSALGRLGKMQFNTELYRTAHDYLEKVRDRFIDQKNPAGVTEITLSLGMLEFNCNNLEKSLPYLFYCLEYYERLKMPPKQMTVNKTIGEIYLEQNKLELAKQHFHQYYELSSSLNDRYEMSQSQAFLGAANFKEKSYAQALLHYRKAKEYARGLNDIILTHTAAQGLAKTYLKSTKHDEAAQEFSQIIEIQDSVINLKKNERTLALFAEIQARQREEKIELLKSEKALAEQQKTNQRNLLLGGIGLTSLVGIFLFFLYRNRQKTNRKLKEIDSMKSDFFANISHELRTPLTLISGPLQQQLETKDLSSKDRVEFEMMYRNSERVLKLVDQVLALSKLESGSYRLAIKKGNLGLLLASLSASFEFLAAQKDLKYSTQIDSLEAVWFDKDLLEKIVTNLLSNAFKYTQPGGMIKFQALQKNTCLELLVANSNNSLSKEELPDLLIRFYQKDAKAEGAGIGLALVKELVELSHGELDFRKTKNKLLEFCIRLPIKKSAFAPEEIAGDPLQEDFPHSNPSGPKPTAELVAREENNHKDNAIVLVVEDQAEVRRFISKSFSKTYKVLEATNGKEGLEMALNAIPDLIISDVMMPEMNGLELCATLKKDERTSHIPVILLTARAGEEDQYQGLSEGADAYITKPFKIRFLRRCTRNLIETRRQLRQRYSQEIVLKPKDIAISSPDERFLNRVQEVLDDQLVNSAFSAKEFSDLVGMSRMQLHRKLKALTGLSATEFIRSQRLKLAVSLLQDSNASISEIAYQVGFNDPSYFTKCFKEAFGCSPREFVQV